MQLRSGLVLPPPAPQGGAAGRLSRPRRIPGCGIAREGEDRISSLPEELLLDMLGRLGSASEAAGTSVISRRWRGLWADLRELRFTFRRARADALDIALAQVRPGLDRLDIRNLRDKDEEEYFISHGERVSHGEQVSSLLRAADRLAPAELVVRIDPWFSFKCEVPCFGRATSIHLFLPGASYDALPPAGEFASLEELNLVMDFVDLSELIRRCPRLRKLMVYLGSYIRNTVSIESKSLEVLTLNYLLTKDIVIVAPELKKFGFLFGYSRGMSLSAPKLGEYFLLYYHDFSAVGYGNSWFLRTPEVEDGETVGDRHKQLSLSLLLIISANRGGPINKHTFAQELVRLPVHQYSVLELSITTEGHVFAPLLLHLLLIRTSIQRLKLILMNKSKCRENCDCDQDGSWRNERISLPDLEDVEIVGFGAADHEVDFLELVFGSAPMLKRINIKLSAGVSPSDGGCQKLRSIFQANASVECNVYGRW